MTVGINPSLTVNAKKHINKKILEIKEFSVKYERQEDKDDRCGVYRFNKFVSDKDYFKQDPFINVDHNTRNFIISDCNVCDVSPNAYFINN